VDFRVHGLEGARANAAAYGYPGARFPWEADEQGREQCAPWQYRDHQVHVTADVVYGFAHFARAVPEPGHLTGPAAEVIVETARYWMARMDRRPGDDYPSLLGVMGPDEYSPISHNNAYTNRMVSFALSLAAGEAAASGGATEEERAAFAGAAERLPIPRSPDGRLVMQCEDFELLADPWSDKSPDEWSRRYGPKVTQERLYRSRIIKQADVLLLMFLFAKEFTDDEVRAAWDYYLPYTTHDSSLSAGVHAIMACRLGLAKEAREFWERSTAVDFDVARGGAAAGIHIACAAANWQAAVFGFAGMVTAMQTETLTLRPRLPEGWTRLAFPVVWKGSRVFVDVRESSVSVANRDDTPLDVCVDGATRTVQAGETVSFG
jgi:kojibiose phosphorylase